ncbi:uncharacterized protein [Asterias amurensis]|uniref:uncharacterized protein n=1 Tax=Asterias amurensis TaxID=7602 RepID=UPI003AB87A1F
MKVKIISWTAVSTWRWIANDDNCGICRMAFDSCCPDCKMPGDDCPLGETTLLKNKQAWNYMQVTEAMTSDCPCSCMGAVFPCVPYALHLKVAQLPAGTAAVPHVQTRVEVQGVKEHQA